MSYRPSFDLPETLLWPGDPHYDGKAAQPYLFTEETAVAVDVALATRRPLLVAGPPGSGKSRLAPAMAGILKSRYLAYTFTSRSRLGDLTSEVDHLRRLHDAQTRLPGDTRPLPRPWAYRDPGLFWWAFDPLSARRRGGTDAQLADLEDQFQAPVPPSSPGADRPGDLVMLLDEIDKADPDLPNDLLEPLDRMAFPVPDSPTVTAPETMTLLVIITTNGERELPPAFLRRCVSLVLLHPGKERLTRIGQQHFPTVGKGDIAKITQRFLDLRRQAQDEGLRLPSTSEYLDFIRAAIQILRRGERDRRSKVWQQVERATLLKRTDWLDDIPDE